LDTYLIVRRAGWLSTDELREAVARAKAACELMPDDVRWCRSYVLEEADGTVGSFCVFEASSIEALHLHAGRADLPVDEIVKVSATVVVRPDAVPV
jgi:Nickel responsive protein SCO4226-like